MRKGRGKYSIGFFSNGSKSMGSNISFSSSDFGSRDESFYDSKVCFDSDCDEEFYSVKGDFTPSRTSTPNNQIATPTSHRLSKSFSIGPIVPIIEKEIKSFPDEKKPRLADLLKAEQESIEQEKMMKNSNGFKTEKSSIRRRKGFRIVRCCIPGLGFNFVSKEHKE